MRSYQELALTIHQVNKLEVFPTGLEQDAHLRSYLRLLRLELNAGQPKVERVKTYENQQLHLQLKKKERVDSCIKQLKCVHSYENY